MINKIAADRLVELAELYRSRNAIYGDSFHQFGKVMAGLFPKGLPQVLVTETDWNRLAVVCHLVDKLIRYSNNFTAGGHPDSLDDIAVYSQILQFLDHEKES